MAADVRAPGANGPFVVGTNDNGNPLTEDDWHHIAIVRTDKTPSDLTDSEFDWTWYIDGQLSSGHTSTTSDPTPLDDFDWLIAGRQGGDVVRALIDEVRMTAALSPSRFLNAVGSLPGDFDNNGVLDVLDIDDLTMQSAGGNHPTKYDLYGDSLVNSADVDMWIKDLYRRG